jgi:hypothetical protein
VQEGAALRPLGVGDIVDRVFGIYRQRPLLFIVVAAIPQLLLYLFIGVLVVTFAGGTIAGLAELVSGQIDPESFRFERLAPLVGTFLLFALVVGIAAIGVSLMQSASLVEAVAARYMGREITAGAALRAGLRAIGRLLVMGVLAFLAFAALWIGLVIFMALVPQWWAFLLGILGGLVASVFLAASWMVAPAVVILENAGPVTALRRSWSLSTGNRWRILGLILLLIVIEIVLSSLLSTLLVAAVAADQVVRFLVQQGVNLLASIAWAPVYWGTFAVLYYDLRVRREALDLQLAAEALPRATT